MQTLYQVIKEWPSDLYNAKAIIYAVNVSWCMYHFTFICVSVADGYASLPLGVSEYESFAYVYAACTCTFQVPFHLFVSPFIMLAIVLYCMYM